ncbi:SGNH/GDSL hydrolase family protein [Sphingomonas hylomeconis]|uniref:SGNH/GDSL hydrolase family protein n=1 Tax=Sphingomonas hylomeconis TaxID=1395958 RepID=A0ABV7T056_9SPHN|nr:SGNH/GDSL hydrolase family protein [Sphingomonas hylomeconis]
MTATTAIGRRHVTDKCGDVLPNKRDLSDSSLIILRTQPAGAADVVARRLAPPLLRGDQRSMSGGLNYPAIGRGTALLLATICLASATTAIARDRWVSAWGTAQQLAPMPPPRIPPPPAGGTRPAPPPPAAPSPIVPTPEKLADQTIRMVVRPTIGGSLLRVQFSNASGGEPVTIAQARLAKSAAGGAITTTTDRAINFAGQPSVVIQPGTMAISDPVRLDVAALDLLAVSIHLAGETAVNTLHPLGLRTTYVAKGDRTSDASLPGAETNRSYFWLTGLEMQAPETSGAIVTFGDSITDGYGTTPNTARAWPDLLADRLQHDPRTRGLSVINMGISGNRVRRDGAGLSALARFDRDVLARPGVRWAVLLEGINDINFAAIPGIPASEAVTAEQLIAAYTQFIDQAHGHGIKVAGATITPTEGLWLYSAKTEALRQTLNGWIRDSGKFDAVIDFDAAVRDPARATRLNPAFDPGDHVHPNDAGNAAMAAAIDLAIFTQ